MRIESPYGVVRVQVLVSDRVEGKQLYMSLNSVEEPVNRLTSSHVDREAARQKVGKGEHQLGERETAWWANSGPDGNRRMPWEYASSDWFSGVDV